MILANPGQLAGLERAAAGRASGQASERVADAQITADVQRALAAKPDAFGSLKLSAGDGLRRERRGWKRIDSISYRRYTACPRSSKGCQSMK